MGNCLSSFKRSKEIPAAASPSSSTKSPEDLHSEEIPAAASPSSSTKFPEDLQECIGHFKEIEDSGNIDELIDMAYQLFQRIKSKQQRDPQNASTSSQPTQDTGQESGVWASITNKGSQFLEWLNKVGSSEKLHQGIKVVAETLPQVGQINSTVAGLSTIAFVLSKYEKMRDNQPECLQALGDLIDLARHLQSLKKIIPEEEEKYTKAIHLIVEGSITCLCQSNDNKLFRFIKSSLNAENLASLRKRINELYPNLVLTTIIDTRKDIPAHLPIMVPVYPMSAVGFENRVEKILDILGTTGQASLAVVIYGFGGLGKTTLADAVASNIDLKIYDYTRFEIYEESQKNDLKKSQERILKDCFPDYNGGRPIKLRDCTDGKSHLMEAFRSKKGKPIFLYIDNALRADDLESLLPKELGELPHGSRILITTRNLAVTDVFQGQPNLVRKDYPLQPLPDENASKILFKDPTKAEIIKEEDLQRILKICSGVPLALKIVGAQLEKQHYQVDGCRNILNYLEKGDIIKEERLSERLFDFVYDKLEGYSREALLDICCFFNKWNRLEVEYIVGADAVTSLLEAGLISLSDVDNLNWVDNKLTVHDIIRANGRGKAKGNRILDIQSFCDAADRERLDQVKGVWLDKNTSEYVIEERQLNLMRDSLRVLVLGKGIKVSGVSQMSFKQLKFLGIFSNIPQLPVKLERLDKLRVFHGPPWFFFEGESNLSKLPRNLKSTKVISRDREYLFTNTRIMIGACSSLEKLDFSGLGEPPKLLEGFNQLEALKILILDGNDETCELHCQICQLSSLQALSLRGCRGLKCLPESLEQLTNLLYLNLNGCWNLQQLPDTFGQLANLTYLDLDGCKNLKLPQTFAKLGNLKYLDIGCFIEGPLPRNFGQLGSLQHLRCAEELKGEVQVLIDNGVFDGSRLTLFFYTQEYRWRVEKQRVALLVSKAASHFIDAGLLQGYTI